MRDSGTASTLRAPQGSPAPSNGLATGLAYRDLFLSLETGFCVFELLRDEGGAVRDARIVESNAYFERLVGRGDLTGKTFLDLFAGLDASWLRIYQEALEKREPARFEKHHAPSDHWYELFASPFGPPESGRLAVVFNDVTARKRAEIALHDFNARLEREVDLRTAQLKEALDRLRISNEVYRQAEEIANLGTWTWDPAANEAVYSDNMFRLFGMLPQEVKPGFDTIPPFIHPEDRPRLLEAAEALKKNPARTVTVEYRVRRKDGAERIFTNRIQSVKGRHGGEVVAGVTEDITERRRLEEEKRRLDEERRNTDEAQRRERVDAILETQENERKRIAESLHNGLGQMLYGIQLNLGQVQLRPGERWRERQEEQYRATLRLLKSAIEETRRLSHELMPSILEDFGLRRAVEDICRQFTGILEMHCDFNDLPEKIEPYIEVALYRIIQELIANIMKHAKALRIDLALRFANGDFHLEVRDNGHGFDGDRKIEGIGLKSIRDKIALLGGEFKVASGEHGTTVTIRIPDRARPG